MKNLLITIVCVMLGTAAMAQTEHLKFKGIPMDCSVDEMARKLQAKGFKYEDKLDGTVFMKGSFAGTYDCLIGLIPIEGGTKIRRIGVIFPNCGNWECLENKYNYLKDMLTQKYTRPHSIEKFDSYSEPTNNGNKMTLVQLDRCKYQSDFNINNGSIMLFIKNGFDAHIVLVYEDAANAKVNDQNVLDDL
ncbi:MAG: hypothetical protein E7073_08820 [Bacteroidales bacterium]|nr:hypothetical protein [Bacteroidales bacterium]